MKAVILAGGLGSRLSEETDRVPKPMVTIGGRPILWHIMKIYSHYGINDFIICLGYKGYVIKEYFNNYLLHMSDVTLDIRNGRTILHQNAAEPWQVTLVDTGLETQTGGRLRRVRRYLGDEPFCFTYGDGLADIDLNALIAFHHGHGRLATVTAVVPPGRFGVLELEGNRVSRFAEKISAPNKPINGGYFVLDPRAIDFIDDDATIWENRPMERLVQEGQLMAFFHDGFWQAMDTLRERRLLEELWESNAPPWRKWTEPA